VRDTAEEAFAEAHTPAHEEGEVMTLPPDQLVEESGPAATEILSEVSEIYVFDRSTQTPSVDAADDWEDVPYAEPAAADDDEEDAPDADEAATRSATDEAEGPSSERRGRRRRRRRRGGRGRGEEARQGESGEEEAASEDSPDEEEDVEVRRTRAEDDEDEGEDQVSLARDANDPSGSELRERKFPTWQEAMELIINKNMGSRKQSGGRRGGNGGGENRGVRGRGRGRRGPRD
jgi:hypothetical protein